MMPMGNPRAGCPEMLLPTNMYQPKLTLALALVLLTGCTSTRFVVIDANSHEPIPDVQVAGYRSFSYQRVPDDYTWSQVDSSMTGPTGAANSSHPASIVKQDNEYRFVFSKAGYKTAEALIYTDRALVASPADDAGWKLADKDDHNVR